MSPPANAKLLVRSALFRVPRAYALLTSEWRYLLLYRLGRVHEPEFRALPALVDRADPLVLDVGANLGQSLLSLKRVLPRARVVCFEPNPELAVSLRRVVERFSDVRVETVGLADESGEAELHVPVYNGKVMSGLASFDESAARDWINPETVIGFRPELLSIRSSRLRLTTLDSLRLDPDVIKIDVQGLEERVVIGGAETIERSRPVLLIEAPSASLHDRLVRWGYSPWQVRRGRLVTSDLSAVMQVYRPS